jgi:DNA helicase IV
MNPTKQQLACIDAAKAHNLLKISACAGGAKTTTLSMIAQELECPSIYLAFNKVTADEAAQKFPMHVVCKTTHSLAYSKCGSEIQHKLSRPTHKYVNVAGTGGEIAKYYKIDSIVDDEDVVIITAAGIGQLVKECVAKFEQSADKKLSTKHLPVSKIMADAINSGAKKLKSVVLTNAKKLWQDRINQNSNVLATHDTYLKMYQLSGPKLPYKLIYLDEAQDSTPCVLDIVLQQKEHCKIVLVGDARQSIYQWRGSVNAMKVVEGNEAVLGQSFRYGQAVADVAMDVLKGSMQIEGFDKLNSRIGDIEETQHYAKLFRTNSALLGEAVKAMNKGVKVNIEIDTKDFVKLLQSVEALYADDMKNVKHDRILPFASWWSLCEEAKEEPDLNRIVKLVKDGQSQRMIKTLENYRKPSVPDTTFTTAHKAKGREWDQVVLADDFPSHKDKNGKWVGLNEMEENLLYVAVTRAKLVLTINNSVHEAMQYMKSKHIKVA